MTTELITAARALIAEADNPRVHGLLMTARDLRDMVATLADALEAERDAALARAGAAAAEMREQAATCTEWTAWGERHNLTGASRKAIRALPIAPDAQAALDKLLDATWNKAVGSAERIAEGWGNCARDVDMAREIHALKRPETSHD